MSDIPLNEIAAKENSDLQLLRLAAASQVYLRGKRILSIQAILTVLGGFASALLSASFPQFKVWAAFYAFTVALLDAVVLERVQSEHRQTGARIQELFDCELFQFPWRYLVVGERPTPELVTEQGAIYKRKHADASHLRDWYPPSVSALSLSLATLVCQRANAWWDSTLRKRYCTGLKVILWALVIFVFALAILRGMTMDVFVLAVLAPLTPALLWGVREIHKNSVAAEDLCRLETHINQLWHETLKGSLANDSTGAESILIQNQLFHWRSTNPFVFNWVYRLLRGRKEETMRSVAVQIVEQANCELNGREMRRT